MEIELRSIPIRDVFDGYLDQDEAGVVGYGGKLNIRPAFQREFVYNDSKRDAVIDTIVRGFPLNVMYWSENEDGGFEILDGQQRTVSFCKYLNNEFSFKNRFFMNLKEVEKQQILDYELMVYVCRGNDKEKIDWFQVINIGNEKLTDQELRNAIYTGPWLSDAKKHFSKSGCVATKVGGDYVKGNPIRQEVLETVLKWISSRDKTTVEEYMAVHQHDPDADELWIYFQEVIDWVKRTFPLSKPDKNMKGLNWGIFYNEYHNTKYNSEQMVSDVKRLLADPDVQNNRGIFEYLLSGNENLLNIRQFSEHDREKAYARQNGICPFCEQEGKDCHYELSEMHADHITPWSKGGKTIPENCQMLCADHNRRKSNI